MKKIAFKTICLTALVALSVSNAQAADIDKGQGIAKRVCAACHGKNGISRVPVFPNLSGQNESYILKQLNDFKSGSRKSNNMQGVVNNLSEQDMMDVSAYYAAHGTIKDTSTSVSSSLVKKVTEKLNVCIPCHNKNGISKDDKFPNLAGQKDRYLQKELERFKSGKRKDATMSAIVSQLDKKDIKNPSKYFSKAGKVEINK